METTEECFSYVCVGGKSTFKTLKNHSRVTHLFFFFLQHWGKRKVELIQKCLAQTSSFKTFVTLGTRNPEKRSQLSYIHFPPLAVLFKTAARGCGFLLVEVDRNLSTTSLCPVHSSHPPLAAPLYTFPVMWQCAQYNTVQPSIQYSRLTWQT